MFANPSKSSLTDKKSSLPGKLQPDEQQQKPILQQIADINILRQAMLKETHNFDNQLDELEKKLIAKANQLQILTSKEMYQISDKNFELVEEFVKYQRNFLKRMEQKNTNWEAHEMELSRVQNQLYEIMQKEALVSQLSQAEILEEEVKNLISEIEHLNIKKNDQSPQGQKREMIVQFCQFSQN